jgi:hypothetical protein
MFIEFNWLVITSYWDHQLKNTREYLMNMPWSEIMPSTDPPGSTTISKHGAMMQICPFWLGSYPLHMGSSNSLLILRKLLVSYPNMDVFLLIFNGCFLSQLVTLFYGCFFADIAMTVEYWDPNGWAMLKKTAFWLVIFLSLMLESPVFHGSNHAVYPSKTIKNGVIHEKYPLVN